MIDTEGNDCGISPIQFRGWVVTACRWHDSAYSELSWHQNNMTRAEVDKHFLNQLLEMSGRNVLKIGASYFMYGVTRIFGSNWWEGKKLLLAFLLLLPLPAYPQELNLIAIDGYRSISDEQTMEVYSRASYYFKEVGITFRMKYIRYSSNPCSDYHFLTSRHDELKCFDRLTPKRRKLITYYMTPPFIDLDKPADEGGTQTAYIAGMAIDICSDVSTGNAMEVSFPGGENRIPHSAVVLAHEVFHNMCATHRANVANLMHPYANSFTTLYKDKLLVLEVTKRQVRRWYTKLRRKQIL